MFWITEETENISGNNIRSQQISFLIHILTDIFIHTF